MLGVSQCTFLPSQISRLDGAKNDLFFENSFTKDNSGGLWEISDTKYGMKFAVIVELVQLDLINATVVK